MGRPSQQTLARPTVYDETQAHWAIAWGWVGWEGGRQGDDGCGWWYRGNSSGLAGFAGLGPATIAVVLLRWTAPVSRPLATDAGG